MDFEEVVGWGNEPWDDDVTGVAVDSKDRLFILRRGSQPVTVVDQDGVELDRWSNKHFSPRPHHISVGPDDTVYVADDNGHKVHIFESTGRWLASLGDGIPADTGFNSDRFPDVEDAFGAMPGGAPFNRPTKAVASSTGEIFVSDGYRNCRVHRFSPELNLVSSWGGPGAGAGCFVIPHSLAVDGNGRVLVCDRENDRIQIFTEDGEFLDVWTDVQRPTDIALDQRGNVYVSELTRGPTDLKSWRSGRAANELPGRVSVLDPSGVRLGKIGGNPGKFFAAHALTVDSTGAVYVSEVPESFAASTGRSHQPRRCLHKFRPVTTEQQNHETYTRETRIPLLPNHT